MIEAAMIWNEPNNKSHWDPELDPDWSRFARMGRIVGEAIGAEAPGLTRVLGGISPIDPNFVSNMIGQGLFDLPQAWPATTRHKEAEGSSYYRHFYMGLVRENGTPKRAARSFADYTPALGICQWFHFEDQRLDDAVMWLKRLGVTQLRTGLSWADSFRPDADRWFDRMMRALEPFEVTVTFCFTPEHRGLAPHHTSPPLVDEEFAEFCARMLHRYWRAGAGFAPSPARLGAAAEG